MLKMNMLTRIEEVKDVLQAALAETMDCSGNQATLSDVWQASQKNRRALGQDKENR